MRERPPPSVAGTAAVVAAAGLAVTGGPGDRGEGLQLHRDTTSRAWQEGRHKF